MWELCSSVPGLPLTPRPLGVALHLGSPFLVADHAASGLPLIWSAMLTASFRGKDVFPPSGEREDGKLIGRRWVWDRPEQLAAVSTVPARHHASALASGPPARDTDDGTAVF